MPLIWPGSSAEAAPPPLMTRIPWGAGAAATATTVADGWRCCTHQLVADPRAADDLLSVRDAAPPRLPARLQPSAFPRRQMARHQLAPSRNYTTAAVIPGRSARRRHCFPRRIRDTVDDIARGVPTVSWGLETGQVLLRSPSLPGNSDYMLGLMGGPSLSSSTAVKAAPVTDHGQPESITLHIRRS